jgi:hypothetical protein
MEGVASKLHYRIVDINTGVEVISDLPHLHQSSWTVRALMPGIPGAASLGDFTIRLPGVRSATYKTNRDVYAQLAVGQRVEAYLGDMTHSRPKFTGIITKPPRRTLSGDAIEVTGSDSLWMLQQTQLYPGEILGAGGNTSDLMSIALGHRQVLWSDDFANYNGLGSGPTSANYAVGSGWSWFLDTAYTGLPVIGNGSVNGASVSTTATWTVNKEFNWSGGGVARASMVTLTGTMVAGTDTTQAVSAEILAPTDNNASFQNGYMSRAIMRQTGAGTGLYNVDLEVWQASGGAYARFVQTTNVMTNLPSVLPFELQMVFYQLGTNLLIRVLLNGKDANCVATFGSSVSATGAVGFRTGWNAGGSPILLVNTFRFDSRVGNWGTPRFAVANLFSYTTLSESIISSAQSHLDIAMLSATMDGTLIRKTPGRGITADTIDYDRGRLAGGFVGSDLSSDIVFEEDVNVVDAEDAPVADTFATSTRVNAVSGGGSGGSAESSPRANIGDVVLTDTVSDVGIPTAALLAAYARTVAARKTNASRAVQVTVIRTPEQADRWREMDLVKVNIPSLDINDQVLMVLGYTFTEQDPQQTVWFSQFPDLSLIEARTARLSGTVRFLTEVSR